MQMPLGGCKRTALDWTTDELVAFLNEHQADRDGAPAKKEEFFAS